MQQRSKSITARVNPFSKIFRAGAWIIGLTFMIVGLIFLLLSFPILWQFHYTDPGTFGLIVRRGLQFVLSLCLFLLGAFAILRYGIVAPDLPKRRLVKR